MGLNERMTSEYRCKLRGAARVCSTQRVHVLLSNNVWETCGSLAGWHRTQTIHPKCVRKSLPAALVLAILATVFDAVAYEVDEHTDIGNQARLLFLSVAYEREWCGVGPILSPVAWDYIAEMLVHEDDGTNWTHHFWDPDGGLNNGLLGFDSAYRRAQTVYDQYLLPNYSAGNMQLTYETLGRIAHLVADMGVPAHVHNDQHLVYEWYEKTYIAVDTNHVTASSEDIRVGFSLLDLMSNLAERTDNFPSNDYDGEYGEETDEFGYVDPDWDEWTDYFEGELAEHDGPRTGKAGAGAHIANVCYTGAVGGVVGLFQLVFSTVQPVVDSIIPIEVPISGLSGSEFHLDAANFGENGSLQFSHAELSYRLTEPIYSAWDNTSWVPAETEQTTGPRHFTWAPSTLNHRVWLRARIWDSMFCESPPVVLGWIDVDSARPIIQNVAITGP